MLLERSGERTSTKTGHNYKRYVFVDPQGTKLQACTFHHDIVKLDACLHLFETYEIFGAMSRPTTVALEGYNANVQITLNQRSSITSVTENPISMFVGRPEFAR
ncbi:uncharacterized protein LOC127256512 [Andrographis paniculata]|uniref:uncharacterized protein LOC127256512 n=1 Tax=Andrographis paniculata TaxID=175694 RepID=UPI0021E7F0A0|nr:uncharacterized protein LOC127256512 [Andrographis paniculata]